MFKIHFKFLYFMSMQAISIKNRKNTQLSFDIIPNFSSPKNENNKKQYYVKSIVFPKTIKISHFGNFQRQITSIFKPLGIDIEFQLTKNKHLELKFIFGLDYESKGIVESFRGYISKTNSNIITEEEQDAFKNVVFAFAGKS